MKQTYIQKTLLALCIGLITVVLTAGLAFAHSESSGSSGSDSAGKGGGGASSAATTATRAATHVVDDVQQQIDRATGGKEATSVEMSQPGQAVTAAPGEPPSSAKGVSDADRDRLNGVSVDRNAPTPTNLR